MFSLTDLINIQQGYVVEISKPEKNELVENFHRFNKLKHSTVNPKAFPEKGAYMLATYSVLLFYLYLPSPLGEVAKCDLNPRPDLSDRSLTFSEVENFDFTPSHFLLAFTVRWELLPYK